MLKRCLLLYLFCRVATALSLVTSKRPIKKVAVIGAGIAGLSLAHAIENSIDHEGEDIEVTVFDSRPSLDYKTGAGIQINGGMSVLRNINPSLQREVADAALPLKKIYSRTKSWFERKDVPFDTLFELDLEDAIKQTGGTTEEELIVDGEVMAYAIMRGALQQVLLENLPAGTSKRLQFNKQLTGIKGSPAGDGITCQFDDGSEIGNFDMVVGCDGVKTCVKEYIQKGKITKEFAQRDTTGGSIYSGIRIRYAIKDDAPMSSDDKERISEFKQYFGDGGWALSAVYGSGKNSPPTKGAYSIFRDENYIGPFKKKDVVSSEKVSENPDWSQDNYSTGKDVRVRTLEQLQESGVPDIDIRSTIKDADRIFELGVYFHNPFSLSGWSKEVPDSGGRFCVLAGDAAHAMPPFLGQGGNQALQDAYCLANKIFEYNAALSSEEREPTTEEVTNNDKDIKTLLKEYENVRWRATTSISIKAFLLGYLESGNKGILSKFRDGLFFTLGKLGIAKKVFLSAATPKVE